jgi:hypothetical protein
LGNQIGVKDVSEEALSRAEFRYQPRGGQISRCMAWCINYRELLARSAICDRHVLGSLNARYARMNATNYLIKTGVEV